MEVQRFEQAILKMAFETDARITTASVAYYLGIPSRKANVLLETLLEEGVLELDSDEEGNLFYFVPDHRRLAAPQVPAHQISAHDVETSVDEAGWETLAAAADAAVRKSPPPIPSTPLPPEHFTASVEDDQAEPFSPLSHSPSPGADGGSIAAPSSPSTPQAFEEPSPSLGYDWYRPNPAPRPMARNSFQSNRPSFTSRFDGLPDGSTSRLGRPDARLDRCGPASVVVESEAACEPKPLANARPTVTSCADVDTSPFAQRTDYGGFGFTAPKASTALATTSPTGEMTLTADNHIDQPEHQPGMALLLSLILCGTGQIYNGEVSKGIIMLILTFLLWFVFLGWVVHIWSIVDAVVVAERINRQSQPAN